MAIKHKLVMYIANLFRKANLKTTPNGNLQFAK
jgi:hypothetical protein